MAGNGGLGTPKSRGIRQPTDNKKENGKMINPPRMAQIGGFSSTGKGMKSNNLKITPPK
jgi:hypothetical protein